MENNDGRDLSSNPPQSKTEPKTTQFNIGDRMSLGHSIPANSKKAKDWKKAFETLLESKKSK